MLIAYKTYRHMTKKFTVRLFPIQAIEIPGGETRRVLSLKDQEGTIDDVTVDWRSLGQKRPFEIGETLSEPTALLVKLDGKAPIEWRFPTADDKGDASTTSWNDVNGQYSADFRIGSDFKESALLSIRNARCNAFSVSGTARIKQPRKH